MVRECNKKERLWANCTIQTFVQCWLNWINH